jgi:tripartite-type tricarboxylate transporter receptor subunit TctC
MHRIFHTAALSISLLAPALVSGGAWAQADKPIRWIVPFPPGGIADTLARLISARLQPALNQVVVVENRAGAGGMIGTALVAKGPKDASMLMIAGTVVPSAPLLYKTLTFDPFKDLVLAADHPINTVKELVDAAKKNPGKLNYASVGNGSLLQLAAEQFKRDTGTNIVQIPYKGGGDTVAAIIARQVDFMFDNMVFSLPQVQGGKMKAIAVTTRERDPALPNVPTMIEQGFPDFVITTWNGVWTTGGSPPEAIARIENEMRKIVASAEFAPLVARTGIRVTNLGSKEMARALTDEYQHWDRVLKFAGVQPE